MRPKIHFSLIAILCSLAVGATIYFTDALNRPGDLLPVDKSSSQFSTSPNNPASAIVVNAPPPEVAPIHSLFGPNASPAETVSVTPGLESHPLSVPPITNPIDPVERETKISASASDDAGSR